MKLKLKNPFKNYYVDGLNHQIENMKDELANAKTPEEIDEINNRLKSLVATRNELRKNSIGAKELFSAGVSILGLVAIIFHEETSVIGGKAGGWIKRFF